MKIITLLLIMLCSTFVGAVDLIKLESIKFNKLNSERINRDSVDDVYSSIICSSSGLKEFLGTYNLKRNYSYPKKSNFIIIAVLNDSITERVTDVVKNKTDNSWFVDTADLGIVYKLKAPPKGKKYTFVSLLTIEGECNIPHVAIRKMSQYGLSIRYP